MTRIFSFAVALWLFGGAVVGGGIGASAGYGYFLKYRSAGILSLELSPTEMKRLSELASNQDTFRATVSSLPPFQLQAENAITLAGGQVTAGKWLTAVPRFSKADTKDLPSLVDKGEFDTAYIGVRISAVAKDAADAANLAKWMGLYVKETAAREAVRTTLAKWRFENRRFSDFARAEQLRLEYEIDQAQIRAKSLKTLVATYPEFAKSEGRQVMEIRKESEKFVSLGQQLVAAETEVLDLREKLVRLDRTALQEKFAAPLLSQAESVLESSVSGSDSLAKLGAILKPFQAAAKTGAEQQKLTNISAELAKIGARFLVEPQFIAQPPVPSQPENPQPRQVALLGALIGLLLTALVVFRKHLIGLLLAR